MTPKVKRYDCTVADKRGEFGECMRHNSASGSWVRYSAFKAHTDELLKRIAKLESALNRNDESNKEKPV